MKQTIDALILSAQDATRIGLAIVLRRERWVGRCFVAADDRQATALAAKCQPDLAVVDICGDPPTGPAVVDQLRLVAPRMRVILNSCCLAAPPPEFQSVSPDGFIPAGAAAAAAIKVALHLACGMEVGSAPVGKAELTLREQEVLQLVAAGLTNREIAAICTLGRIPLRSM